VNYVTLVAFYTRPTDSSGISIMKTFLFLLNTNKIPTSKDEAKEQLIYMVVFLIRVNNLFLYSTVNYDSKENIIRYSGWMKLTCVVWVVSKVIKIKY
jgi:hypothetical protein